MKMKKKKIRSGSAGLTRKLSAMKTREGEGTFSYTVAIRQWKPCLFILLATLSLALMFGLYASLTDSAVPWLKAKVLKGFWTGSYNAAFRKFMNPPRHPDEVHHVIFVKVHKAAGSTVLNILLRFALSHHLNVMLPRSGNILSLTPTHMADIIEHPRIPPFRFDILCNHIVFQQSKLRPFFPEDTKYVAIVREPWKLIQSAYYYFRDVELMSYLKAIPSFKEYLYDPLRFEPRDPFQSFTMNRMSIDLGLPAKQFWNRSYTQTFVDYLNKTLHLVLIADRFEESMVLLKRAFHWETKDILFVKINQYVHKKFQGPDTDPDLVSRLEHLNHHDFVLYKHFLGIFQQKVTAQGPSFKEEVESFSSLLKNATVFCARSKLFDTLTLRETKWNNEFQVTGKDCRLIRMGELRMVDLARAEQRKRFRQYPHFSTHS